MMAKALNVCISVFLFVVVFGPVSRAGAAENQAVLIGSPTLNFSLASSQDRLINYGQEYYGRHNLIITFFPAAYTPI